MQWSTSFFYRFKLRTNFMLSMPPITCSELGPSINGLVTDGNTKICCRGFILALFQSTTANKVDSEQHKIIRSYSQYAKLKYYELQ